MLQNVESPNAELQMLKIQNVELQNADYKTLKVTKGWITKCQITNRRKLQKVEKEKVKSN